MQYLKLWESYQTADEIAEICDKYEIANWSINEDGLVDVNEDVNLGEFFLQHMIRNLNLPNIKMKGTLPLKFGKVNGHFNCYYNGLTTLEGSPKIVNGSFNCSHNQLTSLIGMPKEVASHFSCEKNKLTSLSGMPDEVFGNFTCNYNNLTSLKDGPKKVTGNFTCNKNMLTSLEGSPKMVGGSFYCHDNKLTSLVGAPELVGGDFVCDTSLTSYEGLPKSINGSGSDVWILNNIHKFEVSMFQTIPDYALTPRLLNTIKNMSTRQYNILKRRREKDQRWKTDLTADMGDLGF